jgi:hypothetical protein
VPRLMDGVKTCAQHVAEGRRCVLVIQQAILPPCVSVRSVPPCKSAPLSSLSLSLLVTSYSRNAPASSS